MAKGLRDKIIKAAIDIGSEKGIEGLSVRDVANACEVTTPAMYYHFKNKYELVFESILYVTMRNAKLVNRKVRQKNSFKDNYFLMLYATAEFGFANPNELIFYNMARVVPTIVITPEDHIRLRDGCAVSKLIIQGIQSGELIRMDNIISFAYYPFTTQIMYYIKQGIQPSKDELDIVINSLWRSIASAEAEKQAV